MNNYQKNLVEEHSGLVVRIQKLHNYIYSADSDNEPRVEFANKCIQLAAMKKYEEALRARLNNVCIDFEEGQYFEKVASIPTCTEGPMPAKGNDFDKDCCSECLNDE